MKVTDAEASRAARAAAGKIIPELRPLPLFEFECSACGAIARVRSNSRECCGRAMERTRL